MRTHGQFGVASLGLVLVAGIGCGSSKNGGTDAAVFDAGAGADGGGGDAVDAGGIDANPSAPTCAITAPADGTDLPFFAEWTFVAEANDPEEGALSGASVQWVSDQLGPLGNGLALTLVLDPPYVHQITCIATDSTALTGSDTITVNAFSPVARILHPGDGEIRPQCPETIPFTGEAADYEDGTITASLVWTSDLDGTIGTGASFDGQLCGSGLITVTATATDSEANDATDQVTLTIVPAP